MAVRVPPGRSGRLWLRQRLDIAEHAADLLERKLRILRDEEARLRTLAERTRNTWQEHHRTAATWLLRAALSGGQRSLRLATPSTLAQVGIEWTTLVGVRYPEAPPPPRGPADTPTDLPTPYVGGTAVIRAAWAHQRAMRAAVRHAAASTAARTVEAEARDVAHRVRALRQHWIPHLREALIRTELELEEQERADGIRRRWATTGAMRPRQ